MSALGKEGHALKQWMVAVTGVRGEVPPRRRGWKKENIGKHPSKRQGMSAIKVLLGCTYNNLSERRRKLNGFGLTDAIAVPPTPMSVDDA
jgi:hypothetical protein